MNESQNIAESVINWSIGTSPDSLANIHQKDVNISIYERNTRHMTKEINLLLQQDIELRASGTIDEILGALKEALSSIEFGQIIEDIHKLMKLFKEVSDAKSLRLLLATVNTNMCRRFHTDINDLRMLCTYSGPGTLWLTEDNANREALGSSDDDLSIAIEENKIQQVKTGSVVLLKGAIYPKDGTLAIIHRSPTIEESGEKRLLLRIDTNEFLNF